MEILKEILEELRRSTAFQWFQDIATFILLFAIMYFISVFMFALFPQTY